MVLYVSIIGISFIILIYFFVFKQVLSNVQTNIETWKIYGIITSLQLLLTSVYASIIVRPLIFESPQYIR